MTTRNKMKMFVLIVCICSFASAVSRECNEDHEFACDEARCLPKRWLCDGDPDCSDGSDEKVENCSPSNSHKALVRECRDSEFKCGNGNCIPKRWQCDGQNDCIDHSDEIQDCSAECASGEFQCVSNKQCITAQWKCNGLVDCVDGSDEEDCVEATTAVSNYLFRCANSTQQIPRRWVCDGDADCPDRSDEQDCLGRTTTTTTIAPPVPICQEGELQCGRFCIIQQWVCDGSPDCPGGEDEVDCPTVCPSTTFTCTSGDCVADHLRCNGSPDCSDGSDEINCPTQGPVVPCNETTHFRCLSKNLCIPRKEMCDGKNDCGDNEDESREVCGVNECLRSNGGCSHICLDTREGYYCQCRDGYRLTRKFDCEDIDECIEVPGACSQRCTNTPGGYHCSCLPGYERHPANFTRCKADSGEPYLLFSHSYDIRSLRLRDGELTSVISNTRRTTAIDFIYSTKQIFWCDNKESKIMRADMIRPEVAEVVVEQENVVADGLAVDWVHGNLYYTDTATREVRMVSPNGAYTKTVVKEQLGQPRAIVVNPIDGYLFWTDWGRLPKIERSNLDGSNRTAIVSEPHVHWPNSVSVDYVNKKIYWCDGYLHKIMSSNYDGSNIETILFSSSVLRQPFSVTLFEDRMFWVDWSHIALFSADKFTGERIEKITAGHLLESPRVVHVFHPHRQPPGVNVCANHSCSHLCVRSPLAPVGMCVCPDNYDFHPHVSTKCIPEGQLPFFDLIPTEGVEVAATDAPATVVVPDWRQGDEQPVAAQPSTDYYSSTSSVTSGNTPQVGIIVAVTVGIMVITAVVVVVVVVILKNRRISEIKHSLFPNTVYRKTTADELSGGYLITQGQTLFSSTPPPDYYYSEDPENPLVDDDDVPLAPKK